MRRRASGHRFDAGAVRRAWALALLFGALWLALGGCLSGPFPGAPPKGADDGAVREAAAIRLVDATGAEVALPAPARRVVTLLPSLTETVAAVAGAKVLVGVTANDTYPPEVRTLPTVGDMAVDPERVAALRPDLILAGRFHGTTVVPALRRLGIPVFVEEENARTFDDVYRTIRNVAALLGEGKRGEALVARLSSRVQAIEAAVRAVPEAERKTAFVLLSPPPDVYTAGGDTFIGAVLRAAGVMNVAEAAEGWPLWSAEDVVRADPDVLLLVAGEGEAKRWIEALRRSPGLSTLRAVRESRVVAIDADRISRPGPRLVEALVEVVRAVYPGVVVPEGVGGG
ncbi:ABC transporter substrate-binding protein [Hydrogenibacillus sp. N12]|uniref:ABC transporter substrate-binding protein n=1 Tax=Hydrogenibacillus sp. N12 TaxID=2866627 RepID=UPI001C7DA0B0|nr:ABC transporter substrate-binding protein [Hydrogenibacillus sp. N12]QZA33908.1 ABC transporter substrate-binding protein [Hydrogenibacillus sp. N12]